MGDTVLVGVDGSAAASQALRWAVAYAARTGSELRLLHVWDLPQGWTGADLVVPQLERDLQDVAQETVDQAADAARAMADGTEVSVRGDAVQGTPAKVLIEASTSADLLVVGNVGHSLISGLVLGSVADTVVRHAACPVAVIPLDR